MLLFCKWSNTKGDPSGLKLKPRHGDKRCPRVRCSSPTSRDPFVWVTLFSDSCGKINCSTCVAVHVGSPGLQH
ncbi:hypothetical protein BV898_14168 [Hypsibius exemplaris]|uniref:Uncharacterized protein n=1 Tax=Hypsibius exemplaris TaxID=2072580 RepID=A0A1W0W8M8_HYPEX|nr:hypothetical protein BV898_14168 [Hypsibius exemplaris]